MPDNKNSWKRPLSEFRHKARRSLPGRVITFSLASAMLALSSAVTQAGEQQAILDCPLRDAHYSVESPVMDLMLNPAAKTVVEQHIPGLFQHLPPSLLSVEAPSLSSIMSVRSMAAMLRMSEEGLDLDGLNAKLATIELTDQDRRARCARYDDDAPDLAPGEGDKRVLVFHKVNGFDHGPATEAATQAIEALANELGWAVSITDKGGAFTPETLSLFDTVVWNNVSGDVLTLSQRKAFEDYIGQGGGYLGIHGSSGDFIYIWDWYVDSLLGAQFIGHTMDPHYQDAKILIEETPGGIGQALAPGWAMNDEWYSFRESPRATGASVVATLDESSYLPEMSGQSLRMGEDHPIAWTRCVGDGRSFYTGIGHRPEVYDVPENLVLLRDALLWTAGAGASACVDGKEMPDS